MFLDNFDCAVFGIELVGLGPVLIASVLPSFADNGSGLLLSGTGRLGAAVQTGLCLSPSVGDVVIAVSALPTTHLTHTQLTRLIVRRCKEEKNIALSCGEAGPERQAVVQASRELAGGIGPEAFDDCVNSFGHQPGSEGCSAGSTGVSQFMDELPSASSSVMPSLTLTLRRHVLTEVLGPCQPTPLPAQALSFNETDVLQASLVGDGGSSHRKARGQVCPVREGDRATVRGDRATVTEGDRGTVVTIESIPVETILPHRVPAVNTPPVDTLSTVASVSELPSPQTTLAYRPSLSPLLTLNPPAPHTVAEHKVTDAKALTSRLDGQTDLLDDHELTNAELNDNFLQRLAKLTVPEPDLNIALFPSGSAELTGIKSHLLIAQNSSQLIAPLFTSRSTTNPFFIWL